MTTGFERDRKSIETLRFLFWASLLAAILSPIVFLLLRFSDPISDFVEFHRSGSVMVSLAAVSEVFAVSIYKRLNPSGLTSVGFDDFKNKYSELPARYTFFVLCVLIAGTLISGFGDVTGL